MTETPDVSIIDYGINNLKSVSKAFEKIGKTVAIIDTPEAVMQARCLILPGIGAFGDGMVGLEERGLIAPIKDKVAAGTPILGICLGMQMLFTESEEFGLHAGLDLIPGRVIAFKKEEVHGEKIPHMGWNGLETTGIPWNGTLLEKTEAGTDVYFVHSFYPDAVAKEDVLATATYSGKRFAAVVTRGNVTGTQFHPEKSGVDGMEMLRQFCRINSIGRNDDGK